MRISGRTMRRGVFGAAVLGALGFGTGQAFAAPERAAAPPTCDPELCDRVCRVFGPFGGRCDAEDGTCRCLF